MPRPSLVAPASLTSRLAMGKAKSAPNKEGLIIKNKTLKKKQALTKLQDLIDIEDLPRGKAKAPKRRTHEQNVRKKISDNFVGFTEAELSMNPRHGQNAYERIGADLERKELGEKIVMGKDYYAKLRSLYRDPNSPLALLCIEDESQPTDADLECALEALVQAKRSTCEIHSWCEEVLTLNQLCTVALLRQVLQMPPVKSLENANVGISVLKMCERLNLPLSFPKEWECIKSHMDAVLLRTLVAFKGEEQSTSIWWNAHSAFASLILPKDAMNKVMQEETDWKDVRAEVATVHDSSLVGKHIMAMAMRMLELEVVGTKIDELILNLSSNKVITKKLVDELKVQFTAHMKSKKVEVYKAYTPRKTAKLYYRGALFSTIVLSPMDHFNLAVESLIRSVAVRLTKLQKLWCEDSLVRQSGAVDCQVEGVDDGLLKEAKLSRHALCDALPDDQPTADQITTTYKNKKNFLNSVDRHYRVECMFWGSVMGETAAERVHETILDSLPSPETTRTMPESLALLQKHLDSKLFSFAGASVQSFFKSVLGWVNCMAHDRDPKIDNVGSTQRIDIIKARLTLFVQADIADHTCTGKQGRDLLDHKWEMLKITYAADKDVQYKDVVAIVIFQWLLKPDDKALLKQMMKKAVGSATSSAATPAPAGGSYSVGGASSSASGSLKPAKKAKTASTKALVKALFAK